MFAKTLTQRGNTQLVSRCPPAYVFPSQGCLIPCISVLASVSLPCDSLSERDALMHEAQVYSESCCHTTHSFVLITRKSVPPAAMMPTGGTHSGHI